MEETEFNAVSDTAKEIAQVAFGDFLVDTCGAVPIIGSVAAVLAQNIINAAGQAENNKELCEDISDKVKESLIEISKYPQRGNLEEAQKKFLRVLKRTELYVKKINEAEDGSKGNFIGLVIKLFTAKWVAEMHDRAIKELDEATRRFYNTVLLDVNEKTTNINDTVAELNLQIMKFMEEKKVSETKEKDPNNVTKCDEKDKRSFNDRLMESFEFALSRGADKVKVMQKVAELEKLKEQGKEPTEKEIIDSVISLSLPEPISPTFSNFEEDLVGPTLPSYSINPPNDNNDEKKAPEKNSNVVTNTESTYFGIAFSRVADKVMQKKKPKEQEKKPKEQGNKPIIESVISINPSDDHNDDNNETGTISSDNNNQIIGVKVRRKMMYKGDKFPVKSMVTISLSDISIIRLFGYYKPIEKFFRSYYENVDRDRILFADAEWMQNVDLQKYLSKRESKRMSWTVKRQIAEQIAKGLSYCIDRNVYHRDVRRLAVPEHPDEDHIDKCQVYSFAILLLEISTRQFPFSNIKRNVDVIERIKSGERLTSFSEDAPEQCKKLVKQTWHQERNRRLEMKDLRKQLDKTITIRVLN